MKWIGQHIYDLVSRFRNDVYLEDISTGTIASGAHLGLDSNNKIVKAVDGGGDLTSIIAGTGLSGTNLTGPIPTLNVDASQTQITSVGTIGTGVWQGTAITAAYIAAAQTNITSLGTLTDLTVDNVNINGDTITASGDLAIVATGNDISVDTDNFVIESSTSQKPFLELKNTANDNKGSMLQFTKDKGAAGADNDTIGIIKFVGDDAAQTQTSFAQIRAQVSEAGDSDEAGRLTISVAESNGTTTQLTTGLVLEGEHATDGEVDVTIAAGAASTTTIAGTLTMGSTAAMTNAGLLSVANQSNITGVGTIDTGVWRGTAITSAYLDADTAHLSTQKHITHHSFTADIDTTKTYVGMVDADSEATTTTGIDMPLILPVASKLLQVTLRSNKNLSGLTYTWRLETQATGVTFGTGPSVVGTQSGSGPVQNGHAVYDFTSSLDSGDNIVDAFDAVFLSLQSGSATSNTKYYITCVWEVNVSSY
jgi:hypothetical protein